MASFNKVILLGNLTRDPELRVTPGGQSICKIGLATTRVFNDKEGNQREETTFVDVDSFGKQADVISQYFTKGKPILVEGRLRLDQWETNEGEKRNKLKIMLESFTFVGSKASNDANMPGQNCEQHTPQPRSKAAAVQDTSPQEDFEDNVPF